MPQVWEDAPSRWDANTQKFLDFLGKAEGAGYNTVVGGGRFDSYDAHPNTVGLRTADGPSTAAGRYQITGTTYRDVAPKLGITDFSPDSQDRIAVELMKRAGALGDVQKGDYQTAINKLGGVWASLPSSKYNQPKKSQSWVEKALDMTVNTAQAATNDNRKWEDAPAVDNRKWEDAPAAPSQTAAPAPAPVGSANPQRPKLEEGNAAKDPQWVNNAKTLYQQFEKKPFKGSDAQASQWLLEKMSWYNNNIASLGKSAFDVSKFSDEGKKAFLQTVEDYDAMPTTLNSFGRGLVANLADPTNYLGLGAGAIATKTVGKTAAKEAAQLVIKDALEKSVGKNIAKSLTGQTAKVAAGGAAYNAAQNALEQQAKVNAGGQDEIDLAKVAGSGAVGAAVGGAASKAIDRVMGRKALKDFVERSSNAENLGRDADVVERIQKVYDNPLRDVNGSAKPVGAKELNARVTSSFVDEGAKIVDGLPKDDPQRELLSGALQDWYKTATNEATRDQLSHTSEGKAVLDIIDQAYRADMLTAPKQARGGIFGTAARTAVDAAPVSISATTGLPVFLPRSLLEGVSKKLGGRLSREEVSSGLKDTGTNTIGAIREFTGASPYSRAIDTLDNSALGAQMGAGREAAVATREAATAAAKKQEEKIAAAAAKAEEKRMIAEGAQILAEKKKAQGPVTGGRKAAEVSPNEAISDLQGKDPTYLLGLSNPFGVPRNDAQMAEFSKVIRDQMLARQARDEANRLAQKGGGQVLDTRAGVLRATRTPLGGPFQELLQGGKSGLNLTTKEAVKGLRILDRKVDDPVLRDAIQRMRSSSGETPGAIPDANAFYGVQNAMRRLQEQGVLSGGQPGALSAASSVRNPISYAANVRNAEQATALAESSAPSKAMAQFARKVAGTKSIAEKQKLITDRMKRATPDEAAFLEQFVSPLTSFGKK